MPRSAPTPCRHQGCKALLSSPGLCDQHRKQQHKQYHDTSATHKERNRFYQRSRWKRVRQSVLNAEPLCRQCKSIGKYVEASIVDHIIPIADGGSEYDTANLQPLCKSCHNAKTAAEW